MELSEMMEHYGKDHQHPTNKKIHKICVPIILIATLGLLQVTPAPEFMGEVRWSWIFAMLCLVYYFRLGATVGLKMGGIVLPILAGLHYGDLHLDVFGLSLTAFVLAWIGQFIGHKIEGRKPSFFEDLRYMLIGPLWVFSIRSGKQG